jgi:hypothetical protein
MLGTLCVTEHQLLLARLDQIRLYRLVLRTRMRTECANTPVFPLVSLLEIMNLLMTRSDIGVLFDKIPYNFKRLLCPTAH